MTEQTGFGAGGEGTMPSPPAPSGDPGRNVRGHNSVHDTTARFP